MFGQISLRKIISCLSNAVFDIGLLDNVIRILAGGNPLPVEYKDHQLSGKWKGHRECHIQLDWLLVYRIEDDILILILARTGTHSDLFG